MTTVQQIYDMAIHILDEQSESSGTTMTEDTAEYKFRTISILNSVIPALAPFSSEYDPLNPPTALDWSDYKNPDMDQIIQLDDRLSLPLLPYFLAAKLIQTENESLAALCMNQYNMTLQDIRSRAPAAFEKIPISHGLF